MSLRTCLVSLAVVAGVSAAASGTTARQSRDVARPPTAGTASIAGVVVDDREPALPVRRAVVTLTGEELRPHRGAITDDEGRFVLHGLPPGRFTLMAERATFVTSMYGAKRPGRSGSAITLTDGQALTDLRVRLWRGAVMAGVLRDEFGVPLPNVPVAAVPAREVIPIGLTLSNSGQAMSNDLGEYRIFGLEPGTYVVRAGHTQMGLVRGQLAASEADVDAMLAALAARTAGPGALRSPSRPPASSAIVNPALIYYPGTPVAVQATPITLKAGEERSGLDFGVHRISTATVRGTIVGPGGAPVPQAFVRFATVAGAFDAPGLVSAPAIRSAGPDGAFVLTPVAPGNYTLLVRGAVPASGRGADLRAGPFWWATADVSVTGTDIDLAGLALQPGLAFSGRVVFDGVPAPALDPAGLRVQLQSASLGATPSQSRSAAGPPGMSFVRPAAVGADGTFQATDLVPDEYRLTVSGAAIDNSFWWLRSVLWNGRVRSSRRCGSLPART
jgi:hypothetical protein